MIMDMAPYPIKASASTQWCWMSRGESSVECPNWTCSHPLWFLAYLIKGDRGHPGLGVECQGTFRSVRWGVWGANLLSSWLSGRAEWRSGLFIWGEPRHPRHAQLSCRVAEISAAEGKGSSEPTDFTRGSGFWFQGLFIKCKISLAQVKNQTPSIWDITGWNRPTIPLESHVQDR